MELTFETQGNARSVIPEFVFKVSREHWETEGVTDDALYAFYKKKYGLIPMSHINYILHFHIGTRFINGIMQPKIDYYITDVSTKKVIHEGCEYLDVDDDGKCI